MLNYKNTSITFYVIFTLLVIYCVFFEGNFWWLLVLFIFRFIILLIGSSFLFLNFHSKAFCNNKFEKEKKIVLTFDDGPSLLTIEVLDLLKKFNVKGTFFCIGRNINKHPEILSKIIQEGHLVGNHSYNHSPYFDFYRKNRVLGEIEKTDNIIYKITGKKVRFFRPPYGVTNPSIRKALSVSNHYLIGWNIRSMDGLIKNEKIIYNRIISRISPGSIILMHDTSIQSVRVLERVLEYIKDNNYNVVTLEELLNINAYES